jgi:hypothetical protein
VFCGEALEGFVAYCESRELHCSTSKGERPLDPAFLVEDNAAPLNTSKHLETKTWAVFGSKQKTVVSINWS